MSKLPTKDRFSRALACLVSLLVSHQLQIIDNEVLNSTIPVPWQPAAVSTGPYQDCSSRQRCFLSCMVSEFGKSHQCPAVSEPAWQPDFTDTIVPGKSLCTFGEPFDRGEHQMAILLRLQTYSRRLEEAVRWRNRDDRIRSRRTRSDSFSEAIPASSRSQHLREAGRDRVTARSQEFRLASATVDGQGCSEGKEGSAQHRPRKHASPVTLADDSFAAIWRPDPPCSFYTDFHHLWPALYRSQRASFSD